MKFKGLLILSLFLLSLSSWAQQKRSLSLSEAVDMGLKNSTSSKLSAKKVDISESRVKIAKNKQYPDFDISGQALYLTEPNLSLGSALAGGAEEGAAEGSASGGTPSPEYALLGQATLSVPIYAGGKIQNGIDAGEDYYKAAQFSEEHSKQQIAGAVIQQYINLYKAEQSVRVLKKNLKSADQRVEEFKSKMNNGILAKNDFLKAQLRQSNVELSLKQAQKNVRILNYRLVTLLHLPENVEVEIQESSLGVAKNAPGESLETDRADIEAMRYRGKAAEEKVAMEKGNYYPSLALTGGYIALDLDEVAQVTNAVNVGVGISYNVADIFKNKSNVQKAKNEAEETQLKLDQAREDLRVDLKKARENYQLALDNYAVYVNSEEQAKENYRIVKDKYDNGLQDTNDLLKADSKRLEAKINKANARANITQSYYNLKKVQGSLIEEFDKQ